MKKYLCIALMLPLGFSSFAQEKRGEQITKDRRFFVGATYSFMSLDMKLTSLTLHSVWYGSDAGTEVKTKEQIEEINSFVDRHSRINAVCIQLGMNFINNPDVKWKLKGSLFGGLADNLTTVTNTKNSVKEYSFNSGLSKPCLGLEFDFGYQFTPAWGLFLKPIITGTMGKSNSIKDLVNPDLLNYTVSRENKYRALYGKISVLASFTVKKFSVFAGPGFYRIWSHHEYKRVYAQNEEWESITEEITTNIVSRNFVDGNVAVAWRITKQFTLNALCGIGNDININASLYYNF